MVYIGSFNEISPFVYTSVYCFLFKFPIVEFLQVHLTIMFSIYTITYG